MQRRVGQAHVLDVEIRARVGERLFAESLSAPASISAVMSAMLSIMAAACSTLSPFGVCAFAPAPLAMSSLAISSWPFSAAT